jgi:hypothetical protein
VECGFLLNVVVGQGAAVLELFASKDEALLVGRDALFVLDLGLDAFNGVRAFDFESDGFAGQSLDKDLHAAAEAKDKVKGGFFLDIVVSEGAAVLELFAGENQALLVGRDAFLVLNLGLDAFNGIGALDFQGNGFSSECLHEDLHCLGLLVLVALYLSNFCLGQFIKIPNRIFKTSRIFFISSLLLTKGVFLGDINIQESITT